MAVKPIPIAEWKMNGAELFGINIHNWRFECPVCETIQTVQDFIDAGLNKHDALESIGIECIGRHLPRKKTQAAFGKGKAIKGKPCDYAGYGLFKINPVKILLSNDVIIKVFDFASE